MVDVDKLSDAELRTKLLEFGFPVMPITGTTRKVMAKKLKLLLENKNKTNNDGRRSLGRYSSEEESDTEIKATKSQKNRRVTMAAPPMQPPASSSRIRKSTRTAEQPLSEEESEVVSPRRETRNVSTTVTTTTRTKKIIKNAQDEYDTGSESESDIVVNNFKDKANDVEKKASPVKSYSSYTSTTTSGKYSPPKLLDNSYKSGSSYVSPSRVTSFSTGNSLASEYAADRLSQIRQRYSYGSPSYDKPLYSSTLTSENVENEETPFLSNFTRRLTSLTGKKAENDYKNDIIKESDSNGASYPRSILTSYRSARGREPANYDYRTQSSILKNNMISFAVLAVAALFFIFLALMYLGIKSDTNLVTQGYTVPYCVKTDANSKPGVNCVSEFDVTNAIHLLNVLRPELNKRAVANTCFDQKIKAHMTEAEIITFCKSNFGIQDEKQIKNDLKNLQILTFANPDWGLRVVQTENNNGIVTLEDAAKSMEQVVFNHANKVTSFVIFEPSLPWRCSLYNTFSFLTKSVLFIGLIFTILYSANVAYNWYKFYDKKQKDEIGFMVERIIDILQSNAGGGGDDGNENFVVINHVRDMILSVADRKKKANTWAKAVKFINENESRVRTEVQVVQGEPFEVWRWIGSANLSLSGSSPKNKSWQGQAFETQLGSVNSLPCSPTPCLKIRGMVEDGDRNTLMIRDAVLSKCGPQCRILHCAVETNSNCVYLKCADPSDAAIAYRNLHGWWYAGQLVTVKYLRLERYMQRFPDSPVSGPPFMKAISSTANWTN